MELSEWRWKAYAKCSLCRWLYITFPSEPVSGQGQTKDGYLHSKEASVRSTNGLEQSFRYKLVLLIY